MHLKRESSKSLRNYTLISRRRSRRSWRIMHMNLMAWYRQDFFTPAPSRPMVPSDVGQKNILDKSKYQLDLYREFGRYQQDMLTPAPSKTMALLDVGEVTIMEKTIMDKRSCQLD